MSTDADEQLKSWRLPPANLLPPAHVIVTSNQTLQARPLGLPVAVSTADCPGSVLDDGRRHEHSTGLMDPRARARADSG